MEADSILRHYFEAGAWEIATGGESGWNNTTRYVSAEGRRYVLRVYETHQDPDKIRFEHEALLALASGGKLPFAVPAPVRDREGRTFVRLDDGTGRYACLFAYAKGRRPDSTAPAVARAVGEAVGRLSAALADVRPGLEPAYPPYYEMDLAHASCPPEKIAAFCESPPDGFRPLASQLRRLNEALRDFRVHLPKLRRLPHQLIHGDINDSNLLVKLEDPASIAAVLDFEFCTRDLRAMEPAVVLSGMLDADGAEDAIPEFLEGFAGRIRLGADEAEAIPLLIRLRKLDVFVHFLGRRLDGVDPEETLREQAESAANGLEALREKRGVIERWCSALI
ncbi:hypothetical protein J19TS2_56160 [Cohnella xylanilytica]|nr:phosphotransferase [Cohnella xylanilytica]GIO16061.1 hypothetical protein J19TS2_56160 [Cohnella xylanilytica]